MGTIVLVPSALETAVGPMAFAFHHLAFASASDTSLVLTVPIARMATRASIVMSPLVLMSAPVMGCALPRSLATATRVGLVVTAKPTVALTTARTVETACLGLAVVGRDGKVQLAIFRFAMEGSKPCSLAVRALVMVAVWVQMSAIATRVGSETTAQSLIVTTSATAMDVVLPRMSVSASLDGRDRPALTVFVRRIAVAVGCAWLPILHTRRWSTLLTTTLAFTSRPRRLCTRSKSLSRISPVSMFCPQTRESLSLSLSLR